MSQYPEAGIAIWDLSDIDKDTVKEKDIVRRGTVFADLGGEGFGACAVGPLCWV